MRALRLYLDTSVIGGCLDEEFAEHSNRLMREVVKGRYFVLLSDLVLEELAGAPERVRREFERIPGEAIGLVPLTDSVKELRDAYLRRGILTPSSKNDATHVALATISGADAIVSWNFRHIVQLGKMKAYNEVNGEYGYGHLDIVSPRELEP